MRLNDTHMTPVPSPFRSGRRHALHWLLGSGALAALAGCGFRLRGSGVTLAFDSLRLNAGTESAMVNELSAQLQARGVQVLDTKAVAEGTEASAPDVVLDVLQDQRERAVVGITASGEVRELQLRVRFKFRLRTPHGKELIPAVELLQERDLSFSEVQVLGKGAEEALLYRNMQSDVVRQVLYRLASVRGL